MNNKDIYNLHGNSLVRRRGLDPARFSTPLTDRTSLAVSHWKSRMDTSGWVSIQPSQPKQAILRTDFDFNVFFSGVVRFQLVRSLTRRWQDKNCARLVLALGTPHAIYITDIRFSLENR